MHDPYAQALDIAVELARAIREPVREALELPQAGDISGVASSGDTTYAVDLIAEEATERAVLAQNLPVMLYTEDQGLVHPHKDPQWLLVVDPIDGTRPAACGFEACCVSVAVARADAGATMADVVAGAVYELRRDRLYTATRGGGARLLVNGRAAELTPKAPADFRALRWTLETVARPAAANFRAAAPLIDETSLRGALFAFNSSAFALCQIAAGKLSAMVDLSGRLVRDMPEGDEEFCRVGDGRIMGMWAYDIAAAALIASEAGCIVTNAWGQPLDALPLTRTNAEDMASCICAASRVHHARMTELIDEGVRSLAI